MSQPVIGITCVVYCTVRTTCLCTNRCGTFTAVHGTSYTVYVCVCHSYRCLSSYGTVAYVDYGVRTGTELQVAVLILPYVASCSLGGNARRAWYFVRTSTTVLRSAYGTYYSSYRTGDVRKHNIIIMFSSTGPIKRITNHKQNEFFCNLGSFIYLLACQRIQFPFSI